MDRSAPPLTPLVTSTGHFAAIALGSNLGDSQQILGAAIQSLQQLPQVRVQAVSHWYETLPVGPPQPNYINGCALLEVTLSPHALLQALLAIEQQFGRVRNERWGPRTLDLDLIFYEQQVCHTATLTLPHPRLAERAFVLLPLVEIAPDWRDPVSGNTIQELANAVNWNGIHGLIAPYSDFLPS